MLRVVHKYVGDSNTEVFIEAAREIMHSYGHVDRLNNCQAKMYHSCDENIVVLKSYDTPVAIAYIPGGYVIDFSRIVRREPATILFPDSKPQPMAYSTTTSQHITKFCKLLNIETLYALYPSKDYPEYIRK